MDQIVSHTSGIRLQSSTGRLFLRQEKVGTVPVWWTGHHIGGVGGSIGTRAGIIHVLYMYACMYIIKKCNSEQVFVCTWFSYLNRNSTTMVRWIIMAMVDDYFLDPALSELCSVHCYLDRLVHGEKEYHHSRLKFIHCQGALFLGMGQDALRLSALKESLLGAEWSAEVEMAPLWHILHGWWCEKFRKSWFPYISFSVSYGLIDVWGLLSTFGTTAVEFAHSFYRESGHWLQERNRRRSVVCGSWAQRCRWRRDKSQLSTQIRLAKTLER